MKKSLSILFAILTLAALGSAQTTKIRSVTSLPATCAPGTGVLPTDEVALVSGGKTTLYLCTNTNAWTAVASNSTTAGLVTSGLLAAYPMTEGSGTTLTDQSGNANNGTFGAGGNAPTWIANTGGLTFSGGQFVTLPAALNSAQTAMFYTAYQSASDPNQYSAFISGSSTPANSAVYMFTTKAASNCTQDPKGGSRAVSFSGASFFLSPRNNWNGTGVVTFLMNSGATPDDMYINSTEAPTGITDGELSCSTTTACGCGSNNGTAGKMLSGSYQLGGAAAGAGAPAQTYFTGKIYYAVFYNRVLSSSEIAQNVSVITNFMTARGVAASLAPTDSNDQLVADWDSITQGVCPSGCSGLVPYTNKLTLGGTWTIQNNGSAGIYQKDMAANAPVSVDPLYRPNAVRNLVIIWGGINDMFSGGSSASQTLAYISQEAKARKAVGWKVIVVSMTPRNNSTGNANKNAFNPLLASNWSSFADGYADIAADPNLGADSAFNNATYFNADLIHPTQHAIYNDEIPIIQRAVNRLYGNNSFGTATTYNSAAAAATATTAGSESTNTMTFTFGATPANCQVGNTITIAGATPSGYNGNWTILTRSATQVTAWNQTTGLGAITVQGAGACPQQQDADVYALLNFGTGNFTLESCLGYSGQSIHLKNINAGSSTIVPFGSETINGASTYTLTAGSVVNLQAILTSNSAGGCTWQSF